MIDCQKWNNLVEPARADDSCSLDPSKICDNCFRCLDADIREYAEIKIDRVLLHEEDIPENDDDPSGILSDSTYVVPHFHVHPMTIPGFIGRRRADIPDLPVEEEERE